MSTPPVQVETLHQILLWPLRLLRSGEAARSRRPWEWLQAQTDSPWRELQDEYTGEPDKFHERHYQEFLTFLPYVQRVLFGEGRSPQQADDCLGESGMKTFRRYDVAAFEVVTQPGRAPLRLQVVHIDLIFFYDIDAVLLNVELRGEQLPLPEAQELLYRLGRAYPAGWDERGLPLHCLAESRFLDAEGRVLAESDTREREPFIAHVQQRRAPRIARHWAWLLEPLVPDHGEKSGPLRYRQVEYYRMPVMAYLALDDPQRLSRADFVRLGLVCGAGDGQLPYGEQHLAEFEARHCWDRFWCSQGAAPYTRYLSCGHALVVLGSARASFFTHRERGVLAQFRHQHFMLFLLVHFQKAALLMFSDRLVDALRRLNIGDVENVRIFKREIRACFEGFLRFTHRYWFLDVSEQVQARALHRLLLQHLEVQPLYAEVKQRIEDMAQYLETDNVRRQANTVVRLTVVTIFGLVGTITTGFLGMNLLAEADSPLWQRLAVFGLTLGATLWLTAYTIVKSKRLSDFLDALSDERLPLRAKLGSLLAVWRE
ncbi:hypothetical protein [Inhella proteolytica]|uniref:CorA-like Mg2+ transporter protein n=1 Tax=Inhella proteolytica TaxID=2795029 RepID=A0A931J643_9BURK|nr:hypothetical protein [Inhella proteolytica]MBH9578518.1 hypothetical protein [Inhella proteolytica]